MNWKITSSNCEQQDEYLISRCPIGILAIDINTTDEHALDYTRAS